MMAAEDADDPQETTARKASPEDMQCLHELVQILKMTLEMNVQQLVEPPPSARDTEGLAGLVVTALMICAGQLIRCAPDSIRANVLAHYQEQLADVVAATGGDLFRKRPVH